MVGPLKICEQLPQWSFERKQWECREPYLLVTGMPLNSWLWVWCTTGICVKSDWVFLLAWKLNLYLKCTPKQHKILRILYTQYKTFPRLHWEHWLTVFTHCVIFFLSLWQLLERNNLKRKKNLFWLTVSEVTVHSWLAPLFLRHGKGHYGVKLLISDSNGPGQHVLNKGLPPATRKFIAYSLWTYQWINTLISQHPHDSITSQWLDPSAGNQAFDTWVI
jgi:hypothetical protein